MQNVLNKNEIEKRVKEFYDYISYINENKLAPSVTYPNKINSNMVSVEKLSACVFHIITNTSGCKYEDDVGRSFEYEMLPYLHIAISEESWVLPSSASIEIETGRCIFEWIPSSPLYITSMEEYCKLYNSFAEYLENSFDGDSFRFEDGIRICFSSLHSPIFSINKIQYNRKLPPITNKVFSSKNFAPKSTVISTNDRIVNYSREDIGGWVNENIEI